MPDINKIKSGEVIRASLLNSYADGINQLKEEVFKGPKQSKPAADPQAQAQGEEETVGVNDYLETARTTSTVIVYDDEFTNYAEIERIESITFTNSLGETLKLIFSGNPIPPSPP